MSRTSSPVARDNHGGRIHEIGPNFIVHKPLDRPTDSVVQRCKAYNGNMTEGNMWCNFRKVAATTGTINQVQDLILNNWNIISIRGQVPFGIAYWILCDSWIGLLFKVCSTCDRPNKLWRLLFAVTILPWHDLHTIGLVISCSAACSLPSSLNSSSNGLNPHAGT